MVDVADVVAVVVAVAVVQALAVTGVVGEAALVGDVVLVVLVVVVAGRQGSGTQVAVPPGVAVVVGAAVLVEAVLVEAVLVEAVLVGTQAGVVPVLVLVVGVAVVVVGCGTWVVAGIDDVGAGATGGSAGLLSEALVARGAGRPDAGRAGFCASLAVRDTTLEALAGARSTAGSAVTPWR